MSLKRMFTNLKIEADKWPWATLLIPERVDQATWIEMQDTIPTIRPQNGIGSNHDVRFYFNDTYVDLVHDMERGSELSMIADNGEYLV